MERSKVILGRSIIAILTIYFWTVGAVLAQDIELIGSYEYLSLRSVAVDGDYAFLATHLYGSMLVLDISDPANPYLLYEYQPSHGGNKIYIQDNFLYAACGRQGMDIINISDPLDILLEGHWSNSLTDVFASGTTAYVATWGDGLYILDISQPDDPYILGHHPRVDYFEMWSISVSGDYACVGGTGGMKIFDVRDPADPLHISDLNALTCVRGLIVRDNLAYLADDVSGLRIVDITDPMAPSIISNLPTGDRALGLFLEGNLAYVADGFAGLSVINISDPFNPLLLASYDTENEALNVSQYGYYTFFSG